MKRKLYSLVAAILACCILAGCDTEAQRVSYNLSQEADITAGDVSEYHYTLNFNPKMWLPYTLDYID